MRWIWIDQFVEFESGQSGPAIKNVSLAEEHLHDHFPGFPMMPNSLIIEGLAQTGGLLVGEYNAFEEKVILAKIPKAVFHFPAVPGDTLIYTAVIEDIQDDGGDGDGHQPRGRSLAGRGRDRLRPLGGRRSRREHFFEPKNFVFTHEAAGRVRRGHGPDGSPSPNRPAWRNLRKPT